MEQHIKGDYTVIDNCLVSKSTCHTIKNPAIMIDRKYACVHRIDDAARLKRDYSQLIQQLNNLHPALTENITVIEYDTESEQINFDMRKPDFIYLSLHDACSLINFITTCGNMSEEIRNILFVNRCDLKINIEELNRRGF